MKNIIISQLLIAGMFTPVWSNGIEDLRALDLGRIDMKTIKDVQSPAVPGLPLSADGPGFCVFSGVTGEAGNMDTVKAAVAKSRAVYVGETHDQANDHLAQLEALKMLYAVRGKDTAVGFEMLNVKLQPILDSYASGAISEAEFLVKADWKKEWGFPFEIYKPIFDFVREKGLKAFALNIPRGIVSKVARNGLKALTAEENALLPADMQMSKDPRYLDFLRESFDGHGASPMPSTITWENYLDAMMIWNEVMGAGAAAYLNSNPAGGIVVVAGNGHVQYNAAIPFSTARRVPGLESASFYTEGAQACPSSLTEEMKGMADFVWYLQHTEAPAKTKELPL